MGEYFRHFDLTSWEICREVIFNFGWIIALPWILYAVAVMSGGDRRSGVSSSWQTLPFLAWAAVATWRQAASVFEPVGCMGPPPEFYLLVPYSHVFALCALCTSHALVCTLAGQPSWTLGASAAQRAATHAAVLATLADGLLLAAAIRGVLPGGGWPLGGLPLYLS